MSVIVPLSRGFVAHVDSDDAELVLSHQWHVLVTSRTTYAQSWIGNRKVYMHRLIMTPARGMQVDHVDHDGLNNVRANLRICTPRENRWHLSGPPKRPGRSSRFLGVSRSRSGRWAAFIRTPEKNTYLGTFATEEAAARARDVAATRLHGPFATLNFPEGRST